MWDHAPRGRHPLVTVAVTLVLLAIASVSMAYNVRVHGRAMYERSDGLPLGIPYASIILMDMTSETGYYPITTSYTDEDGYFDVTFNWFPNHGHDLPNLRVSIGPGNERVGVSNYVDGDYEPVRLETEILWNYSGTDLNLGWMYPENEDDNPVWHVFVTAFRVHEWISDHIFEDLPSVEIRTNNCNPHIWKYQRDTERIEIGTDHLWRESSIARAYAHYWLGYHDSEGLIALDYCNDVCDAGPSIVDCFHCDWCNEDDKEAWVEGFCAYVGEKFTADYEATYGYAPLYTTSYESLDMCGDGTYHDPEITEGYFAALLHDVDDLTSDDHPEYPGYRDQVAFGHAAVFAAIRDAADFTPLDLLKEMVVVYPSYRGLLWETGMNCGYNCDEHGPPMLMDLTSPTHPVGTPSTDSTPTFTWTRPDDDISGVAGYSVRIGETQVVPDLVMDIGDVTSYTSAPLSPGTYYFTIMSVDRAGNWSTVCNTHGPFTVLPPLPADLVFQSSPGWDYPLIPSGVTGNTEYEAHVSPTLPGNSASTYWNLHGYNQGESLADWSFRCYVHIDGVSTDYATWCCIGPDEGFYEVDLGPIAVRGGRHSFSGMIDELDDIPESDETNNIWGRQFIWTGRNLSTGTQITRDGPPGATDGWDEVTSGTLWYNCDGLKFTSTGYWTAVAVWALDPVEDYDCRLHATSTGSQNGYASNLGTSYRTAGWLDAVIVNRRVLGQQTYDVGVLNRFGATGQYGAVKVASEGRAFGDSSSIVMSAGQYLRMFEFNVTTDDTGYASMVVQVESGALPVRIAWLDGGFTTGGLGDAAQETVTDASGTARLDVHIGQAGYNCLVVFRNPAEATGAVILGLEIGRRPPDLMPYAAAGWYSPLVPRPSADGTPTSVALPDTLYGNAAATYVNICSRNDSPTASPAFYVRSRLDGAAWINLHYASYGGNTTRTSNSGLGRTVRGGRHTVDMFADGDQVVEEVHEDNNIHGEQYVWSPLPLSLGTQASRAAPPTATGGWDRITSGEPRFYNCDGLRLPYAAGWWKAMAVMPAAGTDVDLRGHVVTGGAKHGFRTNLGLSAWGPEESDFIIVNFNETAQAPYDVGVVNFGAGGSYMAEAVASTYLGNEMGTYGPFTMAANGIVQLMEFRLAAGDYALQLENLSGSIDWGVSVYPATDPYLVKSDAMADAAAWFAGAGQDEIVTFEIPALDYYCVAVWKRSSADLPLAGTYRLILGPDLTGVDDPLAGDGPPVLSRIVGARPNPFNPRTTIDFELASAAEVQLAVYDLTGMRVRTLLAAPLPAGRHESTWDGLDDEGRHVPSGVYLARLRAGGVHDVRKLVLIQ
jgi:hypothetical protein